MKGISIHAPRVGRDDYLRGCDYKCHYFNPRAPCGARRDGFNPHLAVCDISIHAPRVGRDY